MYARPKYELVFKKDLDLTAASFAAQQVKTPLPSVDPIEELLVVVDLTLANTLAAGIWIQMGLLNILKKATLYVSPKKPGTNEADSYDAINCSGLGLLMLAENEGLRLDRSTQAVRNQMNLNYILTGSKVRIAYRISFPHPALVGELRMRSLLDCQNHTADPQLTLDFAAAAEMSAATDPFSAAAVEVFVSRRDIGRAQNDAILSRGGFFRQDIRQSSVTLAASTTGEQRFPIPSPGEYATLVMAMTKGAAVKRLGDFSENTTVKSETLWSVESGGSPLAKFRLKDLQLFNDYSRVALPPAIAPQSTALPIATTNLLTGTATVAAAVLAAQEFGGPLDTGPFVQEPAVTALDFLTNAAADADDLSSLLNANFASDAIKWELVGNVSTPATYTSVMDIIGRRFRSNVSPFKLLKAA